MRLSERVDLSISLREAASPPLSFFFFPHGYIYIYLDAAQSRRGAGRRATRSSRARPERTRAAGTSPPSCVARSLSVSSCRDAGVFLSHKISPSKDPSKTIKSSRLVEQRTTPVLKLGGLWSLSLGASVAAASLESPDRALCVGGIATRGRTRGLSLSLSLLCSESQTRGTRSVSQCATASCSVCSTCYRGPFRQCGGSGHKDSARARRRKSARARENTDRSGAALLETKGGLTWKEPVAGHKSKKEPSLPGFGNTRGSGNARGSGTRAFRRERERARDSRFERFEETRAFLKVCGRTSRSRRRRRGAASSAGRSSLRPDVQCGDSRFVLCKSVVSSVRYGNDRFVPT